MRFVHVRNPSSLRNNAYSQQSQISFSFPFPFSFPSLFVKTHSICDSCCDCDSNDALSCSFLKSLSNFSHNDFLSIFVFFIFFVLFKLCWDDVILFYFVLFYLLGILYGILSLYTKL